MPFQISVIVPVYNTDKYISRCIESLLCQSYTNFELLLIDDGSTDSSGQICDLYAEIYAIIKVFHISNSGVGGARNYGISKATGKYLVFVDSDDYCEKDYLLNLIEHATGSERLVVSGLKMFDAQGESKENEILYGKGLKTKREYMESILLVYNVSPYCGGPYCKLFSYDIINKYKIRFEVNENYAEDFVFNLNYLNYIDEVFQVDKSQYMYRRNSLNSLTNKNKRNFKDYWERRQFIYEIYKELFMSCGIFEGYEDGVFKLFKLYVVYYIGMIVEFPFEIYRVYIENARRYLLKNAPSTIKRDMTFLNNYIISNLFKKKYWKLYKLYHVITMLKKI